MKRKWIWIAPPAILGIVLFAYLGGEIVMLLWNWLLPPLFGWHTHLLASARVVGALPDFVRRLGRLWRWKRAYASAHERTHGGAHGGTHERTVGKDDARGTRKIPPRASWLLGRYATAGF